MAGVESILSVALVNAAKPRDVTLNVLSQKLPPSPCEGRVLNRTQHMFFSKWKMVGMEDSDRGLLPWSSFTAVLRLRPVLYGPRQLLYFPVARLQNGITHVPLRRVVGF